MLIATLYINVIDLIKPLSTKAYVMHVTKNFNLCCILPFFTRSTFLDGFTVLISSTHAKMQ
jgi:hypothetical protein